MRAVTIQFTDDEGNVLKTHVTCTLKAGMMDQILEVAEKAEAIKKESAGASDVRQFYKDLNGLVVAVFNHKFTLDELLNGAEQDEIMKTFEELCGRISGEMQKN